jgi:hypothetical protein
VAQQFTIKNYECFNHPFSHLDTAVDRRLADVAIQRRLGLLSQRRAGHRRPDFNHPSLDGKVIDRNITNVLPLKIMIAEITPMLGAIGFSILYLLLGGGLGGAVLIFIIAKMLGR